MRIGIRVRVAVACVAVAASLGCAAFVQGGLASAGTDEAGPSGPGGTWGQALAVPGVDALATGGTESEGGDATAISCTSPGNCAAAGSYTVYDPQTTATTSWPFVVSQSDGAWGQAAGLAGITALSSGRGGQLTEISCASAGNCSAAGIYIGAGNSSFGFLADEVDGTWGPARALPDAASLGSQGSGITAMSCPSAGNCTAVGGHVGTPFILQQVNGVWGDPLAVPGLAILGVPADASGWSLTSLSCPDSGDCTAVGTATDSSRDSAGFVVTQTDGTWGDATLLPGQAGLSTTFSSRFVSCPAAGDCTAIGEYEPPGYNYLVWVADEVNGVWGSARQLAGPTATERMTGMLSCATPGNCAVDGIYLDAQGNYQAYLDDEVNGTWLASEDVPGLPAGLSVADAISCAAPQDCAATGSYQVSGRWQEYAIDESGGTWGTAHAIPGVPAAAPEIKGLSCTAPGYCSAAGYLVGSRSLVSEATGTATTLTVAATKVSYGDEQAAPFNVTVTSPADSTPTGTVTVSVAASVTPPNLGATACTVTLTAGSGSCALPATALAAGSYPLIATYNGDTTYAASASPPASPLTVTPEVTTTSLALSAATAPYGHESVIRVSAVTAGLYGSVNTGLVSVQDGNLPVCDINLHGGRGNCLLPDIALGVGTSRLTAHAYPDGSFTASVSASRTVTIVKGSDTTRLTLSKAVVVYGHENAERLSVTVSPQYHGTPGGRVTVKAGATTLCVITVRAGAGGCVLTARQLRAGTYPAVASYGGSASFKGSASAREFLKVTNTA